MNLGVLIIFLFFAASIGCEPQGETDWIDDLRYLQEQLPLKQKDFDKLIDRSVFDQAIEELIEKLDEMEDDEIVMEMQKIVAKLGVSHAIIPFYHGISFKDVPLYLEIFDDGLYIVGIGESHKASLKQKIVAIEEVPIEEVYDRLEPYISYENEYWLKSQLTYALRDFRLLDHVGLGSGSESLSFNLEDGSQLILQVPAMEEQMVFVPESFAPLWQRNQQKIYWYELVDSSLLYIQYDKCKEDGNYPFDQFVKDVGDTFSHSEIQSVVVDIRMNTGGSSNVIIPLIKELQSHPDIPVFGLISRRTFSSGRFAARDLKRDLNATLVGEPTGGSPNSYGESRSFTLPNSGVQVTYCMKYFTLMDTGEDFIPPDVRIYYNSTDYFSGRDPLLEYVTNLTSPAYQK